MTRRIWIIEPHADDAFLSLHEHIVGPWAGLEKTIVTVYCDERRRREAEDYARAVGCSHLGLGHKEGGGLGRDAGDLRPFAEWGVSVGLRDTVLFPVGLQHPEHLAVRDQAPPRGRLLLYLDTPYYAKQKVRPELEERLPGLAVESFLYATSRKWAHIPRFKTQGRYFFHHPPESLPRVELVLRPSG